MADDISDSVDDSPPGDPSPAMALALAGASREKADHFLDRQARYLELQMEDLHEQRDLTLSHLRWRKLNDWMRAAWQGALAIVTLLALVVLIAAMWSAHEARGLVVRSFETPPDFAAKGLNGTILAQRLLDKLNGLVAESEPVAFRSADSIRGDWGEESKVEIPETGVSVGELMRALREWLGHETHVSGEIFPTSDGIVLTVHGAGRMSATVTGREQDLDAMLDRAAEKVLAVTQPYRYAAALDQRGHYDQAIAFLRPIARNGPVTDRGWAYTFWSNTLAFEGQYREVIRLADVAIKLDPSDPAAYFSRLSGEAPLGQNEPALRDLLTLKRMMSGTTPGTLSATAASAIRPLIPVGICAVEGDYRCAAVSGETIADQNFDGYQYGELLMASNYARDHDGTAARELLAAHPGWNDATAILFSGYIGEMMPDYFLLANTGQWSRAAASAEAADRANGGLSIMADIRHTFLWPWLAFAWAESGRAKDADALIAMTPLDCTTCLEMRGRIAEAEGKDASAAYWFERTVKNAPSVPFAVTDWGAMLLKRGDYDGAIEKFRAARAKSPDYADAAELWGEALIRGNRSDLALAKFADASKDAPNWGRLHLEWGKALWWSGDEDGARKQFAIASGLELSATDRDGLARAMRWH